MPERISGDSAEGSCEFEQLEPRILLSASDVVPSDSANRDEFLPEWHVTGEDIVTVDPGSEEFSYRAEGDLFEGSMIGDEARSPEVLTGEVDVVEEVVSTELESVTEDREEGSGEEAETGPRIEIFVSDDEPGEPENVISTTEVMVETLRAANGPPACRDLPSDSCITLDTGERLRGSGTIDGTVVNRGGEVSPGNSPGILAIGGDLDLSGFIDADLAPVEGTLVIELGGLTPGEGGLGDPDNGYDQVNVSGRLMVGGDLDLILINGFELSEGDRFEVLTFASRSGEFTSIEVTGNMSDLELSLVWGARSLELVALQASRDATGIDPLLFGNPTGADGSDVNNFLVEHPDHGFSVSYNEGHRHANWVA